MNVIWENWKVVSFLCLRCRWGTAHGRCSQPGFCPGQPGCSPQHWLLKNTQHKVDSFALSGQILGDSIVRTVFQVEFAGSLGRPQPHGVDRVVPVSWDWGVIRQSQDHLPPPSQKTVTRQLGRHLCVRFYGSKSYFHLSVHPFDAVWVMLSPAVKVYRAHVLGASLLPGVTEAQPIIGLLNLTGDINSHWGEGKHSLAEQRQTRGRTLGSHNDSRKLIQEVI